MESNALEALPGLIGVAVIDQSVPFHLSANN
jgi:hypothetical protein